LENFFFVVIKLFPVILLLILGNIFYRIQFFNEHTVDDLKKIVINVALPSILFLTFSKTVFKASYLIVIITVFFASVLLLFLGTKLKVLTGSIKYSETLFVGCETGLIGYSMFTIVYGSTDMFKLAVIDIGNSIFINVVLLCYIKHINGETVSLKQTVVSIFKTPTVLSIIAGIMVSCTGIYEVLSSNAMTSSLLSVISILANITTPLICIVIGYTIHVNFKKLYKPFVISLLRIVMSLSIAFAIGFFIFNRLFHNDRMFKIALFSMFILPPSFVLPVFIKGETEEESQVVLNTIAITLILSLVAFPILSAVI